MLSEPAVADSSEEPGVCGEVLAFYHSHFHPRGNRYVHVCTRSGGSPIVGLSAGWLRGRRLQHDSQGEVLVRFTGPFLDPLAGLAETLDIPVPRFLVREADSANGAVGPTQRFGNHSTPCHQPLLSILLIRCWDYASNSRWSDFSVNNDGMLRDLLDGECGVFPVLAGEFELYTVFVRHSEDLDRLSEHWAQAVLAGKNQVVWYFLWPILRVHADGVAGCVREQSFFAAQRRMERVGLRSGWPHPLGLYRQLVGKLWVPQMSLNRDFRVPPTVRVHHADVCRDSAGAARQAISDLLWLRHEVWGCGEAAARTNSDLRGVAKLGFSWQGDDVIPFAGAESLEQVLGRLLTEHGSEQLSCLAACFKAC